MSVAERLAALSTDAGLSAVLAIDHRDSLREVRVPRAAGSQPLA